jgi:hypothetical protein
MSDVPIPLPDELILRLNDLRKSTGVEPELTEIAPRRWRMSVRNERVYMEVDYRSAARGRIVWLRSALIVDGKRRPLARDPEHFARIFRDPDNELPPEGAQLRPPPKPANPESAPTIVRLPYLRLSSLIGAENVQVGHEGKRWVISVAMPGRDFRMNFVRQGQKVYPAQRTIELIIDGRDYTRQVNNKLEDALALLAPAGAAPEAPGTSGTADQGSGFGSVDIRRHSVMRN